MNYNLGKLINGNLIYFQQPSEILGDATQYALDNGYKEVITIDGNGTMYETDNSIIIERLPVINVQQTFSKLEFINRFTDTELVNIYTASKTIIEIEIWLDKFKFRIKQKDIFNIIYLKNKDPLYIKNFERCIYDVFKLENNSKIAFTIHNSYITFYIHNDYYIQ